MGSDRCRILMAPGSVSEDRPNQRTDLGLVWARLRESEEECAQLRKSLSNAGAERGDECAQLHRRCHELTLRARRAEARCRHLEAELRIALGAPALSDSQRSPSPSSPSPRSCQLEMAELTESLEGSCCVAACPDSKELSMTWAQTLSSQQRRDEGEHALSDATVPSTECQSFHEHLPRSCFTAEKQDPPACLEFFIGGDDDSVQTEEADGPSVNLPEVHHARVEASEVSVPMIPTCSRQPRLRDDSSEENRMTSLPRFPASATLAPQVECSLRRERELCMFSRMRCRVLRQRNVRHRRRAQGALAKLHKLELRSEGLRREQRELDTWRAELESWYEEATRAQHQTPVMRLEDLQNCSKDSRRTARGAQKATIFQILPFRKSR